MAQSKHIIMPRSESAGFYSLEKRRGRGDWCKIAEFENLITDNGLLRMGSNSDYLNFVFVGSGSTPAQFTDTTLNNLVGTIGSPSNAQGVQSSAPYFAWWRNTWTSGVGSIVGNISEIGVGNASNSLFSRALIQDSLGNPTTITILSDEQLRVVYEHRYYPPVNDFTGAFTLLGNIGGTYNFTGRACAVTTVGGNGWGANRAQNYIASSGGFSVRLGTGAALGPITGAPSGGAFSGVNGVTGVGSGLSRTFTLSAGAASMNGLIRTVEMAMGNGRYQFLIDPPIPKTNLDTLTLDFSHSWGRR